MPAIDAGAPNAVGIYKWDHRQTYTLSTGLDEKWVRGKDLLDYYIFPSNEATVTGSNHKSAFLNQWNQFPTAADYRIGYVVSFTLKSSEVVTLTIREPKDAPKDPKKYFYPFVEVYMYDNLVPIDTKSGKRMHMTQDRMKPTTMLTSIKLTAGSKISEVTKISLSAFIYKGDSDFDAATGAYIGNTIYQIPITRSNAN